MYLLCDRDIVAAQIVSPCVPKTSGGVLSYGLSSFGYDIRLGTDFKQVWSTDGLDPKNPQERFCGLRYTTPFWLEPGTFILGLSQEHFTMPSDVLGIGMGKSSYARCGVAINITPLEPGWCGHLVIEIANLGTSSVRIYPNEGISQIVFFRGQHPDNVYSGYYQDQRAILVGIQR